MRVRAKTAIVIGDPASSYGYGETFDLPDHEAAPLLAADIVEAVAVAEVATATEPETAENAMAPSRGERATRNARPARGDKS